jgi:hypothetical protein
MEPSSPADEIYKGLGALVIIVGAATAYLRLAISNAGANLAKEIRAEIKGDYATKEYVNRLERDVQRLERHDHASRSV